MLADRTGPPVMMGASGAKSGMASANGLRGVGELAPEEAGVVVVVVARVPSHEAAALGAVLLAVEETADDDAMLGCGDVADRDGSTGGTAAGRASAGRAYIVDDDGGAWYDAR